MRTTIALSEAARDRVMELKRAWHVRSAAEVVERLLDGPVPSAKAMYAKRRRLVDAVLRKHKVRRLVAFGSRARGDARPDSDLDLAVAVPRAFDLYDMVHLQDDLGAAFGVRVDLVSLEGTNARMKARIVREGVELAAR